MKFLLTLTLLLFFVRVYFSLIGKAVWPLSTYEMFSERIYDTNNFFYFNIKTSNDRSIDVFPWEIMPMDIYRSYHLTSIQSRSPDNLISALSDYFREKNHHSFRHHHIELTTLKINEITLKKGSLKQLLLKRSKTNDSNE